MADPHSLLERCQALCAASRNLILESKMARENAVAASHRARSLVQSLSDIRDRCRADRQRDHLIRRDLVD